MDLEDMQKPAITIYPMWKPTMIYKHLGLFIFRAAHGYIEHTYLLDTEITIYIMVKVVMTDYRCNQPYSYYKQHKIKYAK